MLRCRSDINYQSPSLIRVQHSSDGVNWTTQWVVQSIPTWSNSEERVFTNPGYGIEPEHPDTEALAIAGGTGRLKLSGTAQTGNDALKLTQE
jgi:predicted RNA methylase